MILRIEEVPVLVEGRCRGDTEVASRQQLLLPLSEAKVEEGAPPDADAIEALPRRKLMPRGKVGFVVCCFTRCTVRCILLL
jgi:hypothetical protein